jgi:cobalt/nickel transport system ATP-binding protein
VTLAPGHEHPHRHDAIVVRDLVHRYPDGTEALRGLSLSVREGDALGVVGPNGAGKSTLVLHMNGTLLPRPGGGEVRVGGLAVSRASLREVRRRVGLVFQDPDDQLFMPTVLDDVAFGPLHMGLPEADARARAARALEETGATALADRAPYHLSGGEKRAVAIATVLSMEPQVLVLDEPSSGLDPRQRRALIALLRRLRPTLVIVSHDLELVLETTRRVAIVDEGRVVAEGETRAILGDRALVERHGLERPHAIDHLES